MFLLLFIFSISANKNSYNIWITIAQQSCLKMTFLAKKEIEKSEKSYPHALAKNSLTGTHNESITERFTQKCTYKHKLKKGIDFDYPFRYLTLSNFSFVIKEKQISIHCHCVLERFMKKYPL